MKDKLEPQQPAEGELVTPEEISKFTMSPDWPDVLRGEARDEAVAKAQLAHDKAERAGLEAEIKTLTELLKGEKP